MNKQKLAKINEIVKRYENYFSKIDNNDNVTTNILRDEFVSSIFVESVFFGIPWEEKSLILSGFPAEKTDDLQSKTIFILMRKKIG